MIKVTIFSPQGIQTHGATMEDPSAWLAEGIANNWWGKPERWVRENEEDISGSVETREVVIVPGRPEVSELDPVSGETIIISPAVPSITETEYKLLAEYSIVQEDYEMLYQELRAKEYPDYRDYLDGIVKNDVTQIEKYISDCLAVKAKYPKPE